MKKLIRSFCIFVIIIFPLSFSGCRVPVLSSGKEAKETAKENIIDLGGRKIVIGVQYDSQIPVEDDSKLATDSSKLKNKVMLNRKSKIESKYNCEIQWVNLFKKKYSNINYININNILKTGEAAADIVWVDDNNDTLSMLKNNMLIALDEYIYFRSEPYSGNEQNASVWKDKHYGIVDSPLSLYYSGNILKYNKTLLQREGQPDLFELQENGQWTWDTFEEIVLKTTKDINGDGIIDQWGVDTSLIVSALYPGIIYSNMGSFTREEDGRILNALYSPEVIDALKFASKIYRIIDAGGRNAYKPAAIISGSCAMWPDHKSVQLNDFQKPDFDTGLVLYPRGTKASDYNLFSLKGNFYAIPSSTKEPEKVAAVLKHLFSLYDNTEDEYLKIDDMYKDINKNDLATLKMAVKKMNYTWAMDRYFTKVSDGKTVWNVWYNAYGDAAQQQDIGRYLLDNSSEVEAKLSSLP